MYASGKDLKRKAGGGWRRERGETWKNGRWVKTQEEEEEEEKRKDLHCDLEVRWKLTFKSWREVSSKTRENEKGNCLAHEPGFFKIETCQNGSQTCN